MAPDASQMHLCPTLTSVTVFSDRAQLTYEADVSLSAGTHAITVKGDKPWAGILPATVRVGIEGADAPSVFLRGVRYDSFVGFEDVRERVREVEARLQDAEDRLRTASDAVAVHQRVSEALDRLEARVRGIGAEKSEKSGNVGNAPAVSFLRSPAGWDGLVRLLVERRRAEGAAAAAGKARVERRRAERDELERRRRELRGDQTERAETSVRVTLTAARAAAVRVVVRFVAMGASWAPLYDVRVEATRAAVALTYHALVQQSSAADWTAVRMRLSTATPHFTASPPELGAWRITLEPPKPVVQHRKMARCAMLACAAPRAPMVGLMANAAEEPPEDEADAPIMAAAPVEAAEVTASVTASTFQIVGLASIKGDNNPVKVTIAHQSLPLELMYHAVPKRDTQTYLLVKATNTSPYVFLPGKTNVFAGNTFLSNSTLEMVPAGAEFTTSLGADDAIRVVRKQLRRMKSTAYSMLQHPRTRIEYEYAFIVKGNASAASTLVVRDQCPVPSHSSITVEVTEPSKRELSEGKTSDGSTCSMDNTGVMEWRLRLQPGVCERTFRFAFRVEGPQNTAIDGLEEE